MPKKIIIVEDDKLLLTIFTLYIKDLGHELVGAFTNAEDAIECLKKQKADVVLLDIQLPDGMNGIDASKIIYLEYNTPIIYISSYTDEFNTSASLNYGIFGYLVKPIDKFNLSVTIDLVCWRHQYEQHRKLSEQVLSQIQHGVLTLTFGGKILYSNDAAQLMFSKKQSNEDFFPNWLQIDTEKFIDEISDEVISKGFISRTFKVKIGENIKIFQTNFSLLFDEINEPFGIAAFVSEITELAQLSDGFIKIGSIHTSLINNINQLLLVFDTNNSLLFSNPLAQKYFQTRFDIQLSENLSIEQILFFLPISEIHSLLKNVYAGVYHHTERIIEKNNKRIYLQLNWIPVELEKQILYSLILINDITPYRELEQELDEIKSELRPIFDSSIQRFYLVDLNLKIISFNKSAKDIIYKEFNRPLKKGDYALDLIPQEERKKFFLTQFELAKAGHSVSFKESYPLKNEIRWNETHLDPVIDDRGEIKRILIWTLDITEKEKYLHDLKESQERYELIARGGNDGIFDWDMINNTVYLSPRWKALLGYEDYELKNEFGVRDSLIHPEDKEKAQKILIDYLEGKSPIYENEFRLKHKRGYYIWVIERGEILKDEHGNKIRFAGSITDITRLKKTEDELLKLNQTLLDERKMFMQGSVVITRIKADESKKFIYISENVKDVLGFSVEEFTQGKITYDSLIHKEDLEMHQKEREDAISKNVHQISFTPYRMKRKDGTYIWVKDFSTLVINSDGTTDILGYFIDISEQKRSEEELINSNKRFIALFEEASDAILLLDELKIIDANKNAELLFGYSKDQLKTMDILGLSPTLQPNKENSLDRFNRKILNAMTGTTKAFYWQFLNAQQKIVDTEIGISPIVVNNKRIIYQAIIRNITDRKKLENILKENERKFKNLLESIPDLLFILDKTNTYIYFKPDKDKVFDIPHDKVIGKKVSDFFTGDILERYLQCIDTCRKTKQITTINYSINSPIGMRKFEARLSLLNENEILQVVRDLGPAE
ncbi:MAG: PAS domain S-box protein [Bacteroidales bacterium]|nr:PAS domain S-box protein [Bacteroidales bacterium]